MWISARGSAQKQRSWMTDSWCFSSVERGWNSPVFASQGWSARSNLNQLGFVAQVSTSILYMFKNYPTIFAGTNARYMWIDIGTAPSTNQENQYIRISFWKLISFRWFLSCLGGRTFIWTTAFTSWCERLTSRMPLRRPGNRPGRPTAKRRSGLQWHFHWCSTFDVWGSNVLGGYTANEWNVLGGILNFCLSHSKSF